MFLLSSYLIEYKYEDEFVSWVQLGNIFSCWDIFCRHWSWDFLDFSKSAERCCHSGIARQRKFAFFKNSAQRTLISLGNFICG